MTRAEFKIDICDMRVDPRPSFMIPFLVLDCATPNRTKTRMEKPLDAWVSILAPNIYVCAATQGHQLESAGIMTDLSVVDT